MSEATQKPQAQQPARSRAGEEFDMLSGRFWQPFSALRDSIDRIFEDLASGRHRLPWQGAALDMQPVAPDGFGFGATLPVCEVEERDGEYRLSVELPGYAEDEIGVEVAGDLLTVRAEHREEREGRAEGRRYTERRQGRAMRSFRLPPDVERDRITAESRNGMLTLTLPKSEAGKSGRRRIEIAKA